MDTTQLNSIEHNLEMQPPMRYIDRLVPQGRLSTDLDCPLHDTGLALVVWILQPPLPAATHRHFNERYQFWEVKAEGVVRPWCAL